MIFGEKAVYSQGSDFFLFFEMKMRFSVYEDEYCYYVRKPAGEHSTFWEEYSFLEKMRDEKQDSKVCEIMENGWKVFGQEEEFWLLNRLDTLTTGLLYFAKTMEVKKEYKKLQNEGALEKFYVAEVRWDLWYWVKENGNQISFPIAHHKFSVDRMVVISSDLAFHKMKGASHEVKTEILEREYDVFSKTSTVFVKIQKGIRHQIRSHFADIGYPLVWDPIYGKKKDPFKWKLWLVSVGLHIW